MDIKIYEKPVITKFVTIDGIEFELSKLYGCLVQMLDETIENDRYGDYSLRDYQLIDYETTNNLVNMGLVKNYTASRMANVYCMKDKKGIEDLLNTLYELDIYF
jgi:hypothetical protein